MEKKKDEYFTVNKALWIKKELVKEVKHLSIDLNLSLKKTTELLLKDGIKIAKERLGKEEKLID